MDFSFSNTKILTFFDGSDENPPVDEIIYLHVHPLIRPNFLVELDELVLQAGQRLQSMKITGFAVQEMTRIAGEIGRELPGINEDNALKVLKEMRNLRRLCLQLLDSRNIN